MSIDLKTILLISLIVVVLGVIIFLGVKIVSSGNDNTTDVAVETNTKPMQNDVMIENKTEAAQNKVIVRKDSNTSKNTTEEPKIFNNEDLTQIYGTGLTVNNNSPKTDFPEESFFNTGFNVEGNSKAIYYIPNGWTRSGRVYNDPITGATVECKVIKTETFINETYQETTYEDVINAFIENQRITAIYPNDIEFSIRQLETAGGTFPIVVKRDGFIVTSYIIFIKGLYSYNLQVKCALEDYSEDMIKTIDDIFSSYKII